MRIFWATMGQTNAHRDTQADDALRVALVTDAHYADKEPAIGRIYRDSLPKLAAAVDALTNLNPDVAVQLGDFIDSTGPEDADRLREINAVFEKLPGRRCYVLGNHCLERLSKREYLQIVGQAQSNFSFDCKGVHLVVLDACFTADGKSYDAGHYEWTDSDIPPAQQQWLAADLASTSLPTIVFVHQRLDSPDDARYRVVSDAAVRAILETSDRVKLVVQGHDHPGAFRTINGVAYLTLPSLVTSRDRSGGGYSLLRVWADGRFAVQGYGEHRSFDSPSLKILETARS